MDALSNIEFGKYRLIRRIAVGGMAQIWLAVQHGPHGFEKTAVLKVILPELCTNDDFVQMFLDEARLAAGLDHTNVVRIYEFGEVNGQYYLAMEHLPGEDLVSIMQAQKRAKRMVPIEIACELIIGAANGLHFAHELTDKSGRPLNVVHRDVSPSNIIVTYHGTVKLVDFGIARAESNISKTAAGTLKGKVAYASPEQAAGEAVDRRSDVFALGTVLYELLTLRKPFKRDSDLATLSAVLHAPIVAPEALRTDVPPLLNAIVLKAMERKLDDRFATAREFAEALNSYLLNAGHARSERVVVEYMAGLFDADRRLGKLRVTETAPVDHGGIQKTPSQLKLAALHLSPLRNTPTNARTQAKENASPVLNQAVRTPGKAIAAPGRTASSPSPHPSRPGGAPRTSSAPDESGPTSGEGVAAWFDATTEPSEVIPPNRTPFLLAALGTVTLVATIVLVSVSYSPPGARAQTVAQAPKAPTTTAAVAPTEPVVESDPPEVKPTPDVRPEPKSEPKPEPTALDPKKVEAADPEVAKEPLRPKAVVKGKLTLDTSPWSEVFLKGKKVGDTPIVNYPLVPGIHALTVVNEQRNIKAVIEVEIEAGKTTVKKLKL